MDSYNFWRDLLDTYQSLSDGLKLMWLVIPPAFVLALVMLLRRRVAPAPLPGVVLYSVARDAAGQVHVVDHTALREVTADEGTIPRLSLDVSRLGR